MPDALLRVKGINDAVRIAPLGACTPTKNIMSILTQRLRQRAGAQYAVTENDTHVLS
jgi:hypothetical protein